MVRWSWILTTTFVLTTTWLGRADCQAATFWDWLTGRTPSYQPFAGHTANYAAQPTAFAAMQNATTVPAAPGTTSVAPPVAVSPSVPATVAPAQTTVIGPPAVAATCPPTAYPQRGCSLFRWPFVRGYEPQIRYRTRFVRVPVTSYRPVVTTDPATGCPTTCMQPCVRYAWRLRRVPVVRYRPIFSWSRWGQPAAVPSVVAPASAGCSSCGPGYLGSSVGTTIAPSWTPAPQATTVPGTGNTGSGLAPVPADIPPSLSPGEIQPSQPQSPNSGASSSSYRLTPPSNASPSTSVRPIPDPENEVYRPTLQPPQSTATRDRTAMATPWPVVPIQWSAVETSRRTEIRSATYQPKRTEPVPVWDDSGWHSEQNSGY